jgi:hypothetical protein
MRRKLDLEEADFKTQHVFKLKRRCKSCPKLSCKLTKLKLLADHEKTTGQEILVFTHPTNSYREYVRKYIKTDFKPISDKHGENVNSKEFKKAMLDIAPVSKMRIQSQGPAYKTKEMN